MSLGEWTTVRPEHIHLLAEELATRQLPVIAQLEPIADFEELYTFAEANPTPVVFSPQRPVWRLESVASRIVEGVAVAAHEPLLDVGYPELARILLEHAEYLYAYSEGEPRPRLEAGSALALVGCVCAALPQSELWRLAGFGRVAAVLAEVAPAPTDDHLTLPLDVAFLLANERNIPILERAVTAYNTVLNRNLTPENLYKLPLNDRDFFDTLNLDFPGMGAVKTALLADDISAAKSEYTAFRRAFLDAAIEDKAVNLLERSDTYATAKTYLECLLRLSVHPTPAIQATTEIGIAAHLFPEFPHSEELLTLALRRYQWILDAFFHADGFHKDRTLRSQVEAIADFTRFLSCYGTMTHDCYSQEVDGTTECAYYFKEVTEKLVEACIHLSRPDFSFPPLGALPAPNFDAVELCTIVDSGFQRADFPYPDTTSHALSETGFYVMRDGWNPDAQYLFFDVHPQAKTNEADISRLALYAHGRELTTGSVCVLDSALLGDDVLGTQWITTPVFDWLERWSVLAPNSENSQASDIHHKRAIFYLKGEYFVLHDLVLGAESETLAQVFRFGRGTPLHISADAGYAWTQAPNRSNLFIGAAGARDLTVALDEGSVIYRQKGEPPLVVNTLLFPMRPEVSVHPTVTDLPVRTDADVLATGFTLQLHDTTDTFLISDDGLAEMSAADIRFVGEYLFLRRDPSDRDFRFVMLNGRYLQVGSRVLVDLDEPRERYVRM
ncbi:MAG: hypothetical protein OXN25_16320 [Candidatus Poribacteria bacterium]|nr:hypothetical protein [Candidatus Poribacteria bacterium]